MRKHYEKQRTRNVFLVATLGIAAAICLLFGSLAMPKATKTVSAAEAQSTFYAKAYQMNRVTTTVGGLTYHYGLDPDDATKFSTTYGYVTNGGRLTTNENYDVAMVWTATEDGSFNVKNSSGGVSMTVQTNLGAQTPGGSAYAGFWKGSISAGGTLCVDTILNEDVSKDGRFATITNTDGAITKNTVKVTTAATEIKAGESVIFVATDPTTTTKQTLPNRIDIYFTPATEGAETKTTQITTSTCVTSATEAADKNVSFYAIEANSYTEIGSTDLSGYAVASAQRALKFTEYVNTDTVDGRWHSTANTSWEVAIGYSAELTAALNTISTERDPAIVWKAPADGLVKINEIAMKARSNNAAEAVARVAVLLKDNETKTYTALSSDGTCTDGYQPIPASGSYTLSDVSLSMTAGDELIIVSDKRVGDSNAAVILDVAFTSISDNGEISTYTLNATTETQTVQGNNSFYYGGFVKKDSIDDLETFGMKAGASIRLNTAADKAGIRFTALISDEEYAMLQNIYGAENLDFGIAMMPKSYVAEKGALTEENLFGASAKYTYEKDVQGKTRIGGVEDTQMYTFTDPNKSEGMKELRFSLININVNNYATDFIATCYIRVTQGENVSYKFVEVVESNARSVKTIAEAALQAGGYTDYEAVLKTWAGLN